MGESERERLARLRARQLADRDPGDKVKVKWKGEAAKKPSKPLLQEIFGVLPGRVKGGLIGGVIGVVLYLVSSVVIRKVLAWPDEWLLCSFALFLVPVIFGLVVGKATDFD